MGRVRILTVQHAVPARQVSNELVLETIRERNRHRLDDRMLAAVERQLNRYFAAAGTQVRHIATEDERPIDFLLDAGRRALAAAACAPEEVDLLIYTGVGRGWLEPATANVVQHELGLVNATCFDILDACVGWLRAVHVAHAFIRSGVYRRCLIVNCECGFRDYVDLEFAHPHELEHRFAALTIGEAATATVVTDADPDDDFYFTFKNFGEYYDLCMIPLSNAADFSARPADSRHVPLKFFGLSGKLIATTVDKIVEIFEADPKLRHDKYAVCFGHAASERAIEMIGCRLGLPLDMYVQTHARYGNTVSASVPLGISVALADGRLQRGDRTLIIVGSAGIAVGIASFTF
jgi:3-oxoacyl-[acyl-carrier-protein] synthase III